MLNRDPAIVIYWGTRIRNDLVRGHKNRTTRVNDGWVLLMRASLYEIFSRECKWDIRQPMLMNRNVIEWNHSKPLNGQLFKWIPPYPESI